MPCTAGRTAFFSIAFDLSTGAGATIKLVNQMMNFANALAAIEGVLLATKAGIDPTQAYEILRTSSGSSKSLDALMSAALPRNFEPGFTTDLMYKDVSLAVQLGRELGVRLLSGSLAEQVLQEARGAGLGKKSQVASLLVQEKLAGVEVVSKVE